MFLKLARPEGRIDPRGQETEHVFANPVGVHPGFRLGQQLAFLATLIFRKASLMIVNLSPTVGGKLRQPFIYEGRKRHLYMWEFRPRYYRQRLSPGSPVERGKGHVLTERVPHNGHILLEDCAQYVGRGGRRPPPCPPLKN